MLIDFINSDFYFFLSCLDELDESNYKFIQDYNEEYSGYFNEKNKTISVSLKKGSYDWFLTFVHEFCHFIQCKTKTKLWENSKINNINCDDILDEFLEDNSKHNNIIVECCDKIAQVELECEKMVVERIKKHKLHFSYKKYTEDSNSYICCYYLIPEFKKWMDNSPYTISHLLPDTFDVDHKMIAFNFKNEYENVFNKKEII